VIAIGAAVAAVAFVVWKFWEPIKAFMVGVWQGLSEAMQPVLTAFGEALAPLIPLWDMLASGIGAVWGWIRQLSAPFEATSEQLQAATGHGQAFGRGLGEVLKWMLMPLRLVAAAIGWIAKLIGWVAGLVIDHWDGIKQALSWTPLGMIVTHWEPIKTFLSALWDGVWGAVVSAWDLIVGVLKGAWDVIAGIFSGDGGRIMDGLGGIWDSIQAYMSAWPARMLQFGVDMLNGLINGIKNMAGAVGNALTGAIGSAVDKFTGLLKINSPSRLFAGFGNSTMEGYALGIIRTRDEPVQAVMDMGRRLRKTAAGITLGVAGVAAPVMATSSPVMAPTARSAPPAPAAAPMHINITINAPGGSAPDIARAVRRELDQIEHQRRARTRAWQHDYD